MAKGPKPPKGYRLTTKADEGKTIGPDWLGIRVPLGWGRFQSVVGEVYRFNPRVPVAVPTQITTPKEP